MRRLVGHRRIPRMKHAKGRYRVPIGLCSGTDTWTSRNVSWRRLLSPRSEERFRLAMNNVASGLYTLDLQGLVTYVNPAAEAMFGLTAAELLGKKMHDVTHYKHPDGTPFPASECPGLRVLQESIELQEYEDVFIRKDGSFFPVVYSASPLPANSKIVGIVVGFRDDTYRRQADRVVRESEGSYRLVADSAPVTIWMTDVDNACIYVNRRWVEVTGRPVESHLGNGWAESIHPEDVVRCLEIFTAASERGPPFRMEYRLRRYDGEYIWIADSGVRRFNCRRDIRRLHRFRCRHNGDQGR